MAQVRYLGMVVGEAGSDEAPDARFGRFVTMGEPMPVGTALEIDGAIFHVTRIDESARSGCWVWPDGAARAPIDDGPTMQTPEAEGEGQVITMIAEEGSRPIILTPSPEPAPPAAEAAPSAPSPSEPTPDEPGPGSKKRKRRSKTVMGR